MTPVWNGVCKRSNVVFEQSPFTKFKLAKSGVANIALNSEASDIGAIGNRQWGKQRQLRKDLWGCMGHFHFKFVEVECVVWIANDYDVHNRR